MFGVYRSANVQRSLGRFLAELQPSRQTSSTLTPLHPDKQLQRLSTDVVQKPKVTKPRVRWTATESAQFHSLLQKLILNNHKPTKQDWQQYSKQFPGRSSNALASRYNTLYNNQSDNSQNMFTTDTPVTRKPQANKSLRWSASEDDSLRTAVEIYGGRRWKLISSFVGTRSRVQCYNRWVRLNSPFFGKCVPPSYWVKDMQKQRKRAKIIGMLSRNRLVNSESIVSALLAGQLIEDNNSRKEARALDGRSLVVPFSPEEDRALVRLVKSYGARWALFARILTERFHASDGKSNPVAPLQKRTPHVVHTRYHQLLRSYSGSSVSADPNTQLGYPLSASGRRRRAPRNMARRRSWTLQEQQKLTQVVEQMLKDDHGFTSWKHVSQLLNTGRTASQCQNNWTQICGTHLRHTPFTRSEDQVLWPFVTGSWKHTRSTQPTIPSISSQLARYLGGSNIKQGIKGDEWLDPGVLTGRSSLQIHVRIRRFARVLQWLKTEASVEVNEDMFDLVRGLANSSSTFGLRSKRR